MMSQMIESIQEDYLKLSKKIVIIPRQRNQFTKDRKFIQKFEKKKNNCNNAQLIAQIMIPRFLENEEVFRLPSNIQFPRTSLKIPQLGCLNVDFYSYNYKINRIDRRSNLTTITYEPIDHPFTPIEKVQTFLKDEILQSFNFLHAQKLGKQINITKEQLFDFENSIQKPYIGTVSKLTQDKLITLHRTVNDQYLACLGIDYEMLYKYGYEVGAIPAPTSFDIVNLNMYFRFNALNYNVCDKLMVNYKGEKFPAKVTFHNFNVQIGDDFYEYQFLIWDVDKRWCQKWKVLENNMDYYNLKEIPTSTSLNLPEQKQGDQEIRCGYKTIYQKS